MYLMILMSSIMLTLSSAMMLSLNPISMGISVLGTALLLTLVYSLNLSSWVAFLIFLIYVGGMLVMFSYFVALTPNQHTNVFMVIPLIMVLTISLTMSLLMMKKPLITASTNTLTSTFYLPNNIQLLLLMALILFFTMVVVVKLVVNNKGPLRPFMN